VCRKKVNKALEWSKMRLTCIDFETANPFWGSICAVGVAVIENGKVAHAINRLIKPKPGYDLFNRDNIRVHGITPEKVKNAPEFDAVYPEIKPFIENGIVAAHNTAFDVPALEDVLTIYNIPIPGFEYICTCEVARASWQGLKNYRLKTVGAFLGHTFKHHDAGEDALTSALIMISAMKAIPADDVHVLADSLKVKMGTVKAGEEYVLSSIKKERRAADKTDAETIKAETCEFNAEHPLYNRELVFTGRFADGMTRRQAMQKAVNCGARLSNYVRYNTDFLVKGGAVLKDNDSPKVRKAEKLIEEGMKIKIISEEEFLEMLK
jgi:DNA polymerase-3 subunit epsilon